MSTDQDAVPTAGPTSMERVLTRPDRDLPSGPWLVEPDKVHWIDETTGLDCLVVRNDMGNWCGYVGVPPGHPWHGRFYGYLDIDVHGGLTYGALCDEDGGEFAICHVPFPGRPTEVYWLGFDCAHGWDLTPKFNGLGQHGTYRDLAYVRNECERLALQVHTAASE